MAKLAVLMGLLFATASLITPTSFAQDSREARKQLIRAAENGSEAAQYALGAWYQAKGDLQSAAIWYQRSAEQGYAGAQFRLAELLERGFAHETRDLDAALKWYKAAAAQGFAPAVTKLTQLSTVIVADTHARKSDTVGSNTPAPDSNTPAPDTVSPPTVTDNLRVEGKPPPEVITSKQPASPDETPADEAPIPSEQAAYSGQLLFEDAVTDYSPLAVTLVDCIDHF